MDGFYFVFVDLGVVTQTRILLFSNGKINTTVKNHLESMDKAVYDPIKKHIYVSDLNQEVGSIFRIKTIGNTAPNVAETIIASMPEFDLQTDVYKVMIL